MKRTELAPDVCWVALSLSPYIGAKTLNSLLRYFDHDLSAVFSASTADLLRVRGVGNAITREIQSINLRQVEKQMNAWREGGVAILSARERLYPELLKGLDQAPPVLFAQGNMREELFSKTIAIVGTRQPSAEARFLSLQLALQLAREGYSVVSGLALGIDTAAHTAALSAGGKTIAVLGSGVLNVYPESNRSLAARVLENGALISELHPHWGANAQRLVARNRIISGLSQAVILVESDMGGGAMYTARFALEQGRSVYTFDLPASGNQSLLKRGVIALKRDDPLGFMLG